MTTAQVPVGTLLRQWREHRRLSQADLSLQADISTRHLSFVETGRALPSRDMVLLLAESLDLPLRDRNRMLLAAGFAPLFTQSSLDAPRMDAVGQAIRRALHDHNPYPATVVDGSWRMVDANAALHTLLTGIAPRLLTPPVNILRASLHPDGLAPRIVNLAQWREHVLCRLRRKIAFTADESLGELYDELCSYPGDLPRPSPTAGEDVVVPLRLRGDDGELAFVGTITTFGGAVDVTVSELSIEALYPADEHTASVMRSRA
ncbi:helix-turn-helix domain-containing protein [Actinokineospora sp. UTMC 2448]|uniref:helix-turn-helix domain-containing protein n=1 Tax=Actinokineospora sp. UTMC 2448 TaxID=2268449 RepID=UPI002164EA62|nr:helix-turn-helix transcriptional regulator [Actinokineospora sp. UTMC 2448]